MVDVDIGLFILVMVEFVISFGYVFLILMDLSGDFIFGLFVVGVY